MNALFVALKILFRLAFLLAAYLIARVFDPERALWWAFGAYFAYALFGWSAVYLYRATLKTVTGIELGPSPPRFFSPTGILTELSLVIFKISAGTSEYSDRSLTFPSAFDRDMEDIIDSTSRLKAEPRNELFSMLYADYDDPDGAKNYYLAYWQSIMRFASRAIRESEPEHLIRGIYAAQAALVSGSHWRDVLVSYSCIWDAAARLRVNIRPVTQQIAARTSEHFELLTNKPAGIKAMKIIAVNDKYGFRYDYDDSWVNKSEQ